MTSGLLRPDVIEDLKRWITHRRWFATKNSAIDSLDIVSATPLPLSPKFFPSGHELEHVIARVRSEGRVDDYQLLIARVSREHAESHVHSDSIISINDQTIFEAFGDAQLLVGLQYLFAQEITFDTLTFHCGEPFPVTATARPVQSEQSNSSVIFGDQSIAKFYRRLTPGVNPDLEVGLALSGSDQTAPVLGWATGLVDGEETTLAVVHHFLSTAVDGFEYALASVRDLMASSEPDPAVAGGDFAAESLRLGEAVAKVHLDLAAAFGSNVMSPSDAGELVEAMNRKLDEALGIVPQLGIFESALREFYRVLESVPIELQRIHGDLHLGQVLRDTRGWVILDFEGEPGTPLGERRRFAPSVRDVAGMLRSFDYAARQPLINHPMAALHLPHTAEWAERNRASFLKGYLSVRPLDLDQLAPLMRALEAEKAVYETVYEHRFRPDWIEVPLGGIERLVEGR